MLPELFRIPVIGLPVHTYGLMIVIGFLSALFVAQRQARRYGKHEEDILDFAFWALLGGVLGARVLFIIVEWNDYFVLHPWTEIKALGISIPSALALWQGGLVYWGSIIGGFVTMVVFTHKRRIPLLLFADFCFLGIPLAQVFGRFGCVAAGCCWGMPVYHLDEMGKVVQDFPLAMRFPPGSLAYSSLFEAGNVQTRDLMLSMGSTVPLFPSQIAEAFGTAAIFFILYWMAPRKWFHGQLMFSYAILYSAMRSTLELFRGDAGRGFVFDHLSTSQFISISVIAVSLVTMFWLYRRGQLSTPTA